MWQAKEVIANLQFAYSEIFMYDSQQLLQSLCQHLLADTTNLLATPHLSSKLFLAQPLPTLCAAAQSRVDKSMSTMPYERAAKAMRSLYKTPVPLGSASHQLHSSIDTAEDGAGDHLNSSIDTAENEAGDHSHSSIETTEDGCGDHLHSSIGTAEAGAGEHCTGHQQSNSDGSGSSEQQEESTEAKPSETKRERKKREMMVSCARYV